MEIIRESTEVSSIIDGPVKDPAMMCDESEGNA